MRSRFFAVGLSVLAAQVLYPTLATASQGDTITIDPPATMSANGQDFSFGLRAVQNNGSGAGDIWFGFRAGDWFAGDSNFSVCSIHGDPANADPTNPGKESGKSMSYECGRSYNMSVKFDKCLLSAQLHGYAHSDAPNPAALGPATVEVKFEKKSSNSGQLKVTTFTLAGKIEFEGKVTGAILMPSCP